MISVQTGGDAEKVFRSEWARLRADPRPVTRDEIAALQKLAETPRESILVAAIEIVCGRVQRDPALFGSGLQRFRSGLHEEQLEVLCCFSDLAILGSPHHRVAALTDFWAGELGVDDEAVRLLRRPEESAARQLLDNGPEFGSRMPSGLRQELRREVGWTALDAYAASRSPVWLELLRSKTIALGPNEAGFWEYELLRAVTALAQGFVDDAVAKVRTIVEDNSKSGWRLDAVARSVTSNSILAAPRALDWLCACPGEPLRIDYASSAAEELGAGMALAATGTWSEATQASILRLLETRPAATFLYLLQLAHTPIGPLLAQTLVRSATEHTYKGLPWPNRHDAFAEACLALPPDVGLPLLASTARFAPSPQLTTQVIRSLEGASAATLDVLDRPALIELMRGVQDQLSPGTTAMLNRTLIYRVIVDGSPLLLAGTHRADRPGAYKYYQQARSDLEEAGFRDIITYFDATTRHRVPAADWAQVEALEAHRQAMVVRGQADIPIIKEFLRSPERSWILTSDDYRDHLDHFPELQRYWFSHRLHFHVDQNDRIVWGRPLDSSHLPREAPKTPRRSSDANRQLSIPDPAQECRRLDAAPRDRRCGCRFESST